MEGLINLRKNIFSARAWDGKDILNILFVFFLLYFAFRLAAYHYQIISYPYPLEYREGAVMAPAYAMLKGENPFSLASQPQHTDVYGIVYHWVVYPLVRWLGVYPYVYRLVSGFFILAACALLSAVLRKEKVPFLLNASATLIFYASLLAPSTTTPIAGPHSLGLFLFLSSIYVPWSFNYSRRSLVISICLVILAFYTKPYFVLAAGAMALYLFLFISKRKGVLYGVIALGLLLITGVIMHRACDVYFNNTFFIHTNATDQSLSHCHRQFRTFLKYHAGVLGLLGLLLLPWGRDRWKTMGQKFKQGLMAIVPAVKALQWSGFSRPLIDKALSLNSFFLGVSFLVLYFFLARNGGSFMAYLFQLLSPFFLAAVFKTLGRAAGKWFWLMVPVLALNMYLFIDDHSLSKHLKARGSDGQEWKGIEAMVAKYHNILNSPAIAPLLIQYGRPVYDSGFSEYFKMGAYRSPVCEKFFPLDGRITERHYRSMEAIRRMVREKKFDLIVLTKNYAPFASQDIEQYYEYKGEVKIALPHMSQHWVLVVWRPKP